VAVALWADGLGWKVLGGGGADLVLTIAWVVGVVNSFNLLDNMDGACASTAAAAGGGVGTLSLATGQHAVAAVCFALAGACLAFLRFNLARPARVFLGDGGSMPIGLTVAATAMIACSHDGLGLGAGNVVVAVLMAGTAALDTALVVVSRLRAGRSLLSGGNDHLTHRFRPLLGSALHVALVLAIIQSVLCGVALGAGEAGLGYVVAAGLVALAGGLIAIALLDGVSPPLGATSASAVQRA
jgi:UDP-GlcNAc:undecaprenyl-phosphate GlcNAc-1-phosphate transferase